MDNPIILPYGDLILIVNEASSLKIVCTLNFLGYELSERMADLV